MRVCVWLLLASQRQTTLVGQRQKKLKKAPKNQTQLTVTTQRTARIRFNHRARPAQLELEQVRADDEGEYRCRVDFKRGRTVNTIISLRVIVPPSELSIVLASELGQLQQRANFKPRKLSGLIGLFNEGDELQLACLAQGGKPRPQLTWRRDFNQLDSVEQLVDKEG